MRPIKTQTMYRIYIILALLSLPLGSIYGRTISLKSNIPIEKQLVYPNTMYVVNSSIDCGGKVIEMPANCVLNIKSGALRNGSISGNKTKLNTCSDKGIAVILKGSWLAPVINDLFFDSSVLTDDQIIGNINTLQSDDISNSIIIGTKDYHCTITKLNGAALVLRSNTKCILKSIITLLPCAFPNYQIVQIYDVHDVEFKGGKIVGDLLDHPYTSGSSHEWGHGISIKNAQRIKVTSVFVTHCIGDGIVVGGWQEPNTNVYDKAAKQVRLENIVSDDNRRQAMTISHADGVVVNNCRLTNTGKTKFTAPSAGLDIEPNSEAPWNQGVKNVLIENCFFAGNKYRQFLSHGYLNSGDEDNIQNVTVKGCTFEGNCDVHTGGITFVSSTMESATFRGGRDKIRRVDFNGCTFTGEKPLMFQGTMYKNDKGKPAGGDFGIISLKKCVIYSRKSKEALLSSNSSEIGELNDLVLDNCTIINDKETNNRSIVSRKFKGRVIENNSRRIPRK